MFDRRNRRGHHHNAFNLSPSSPPLNPQRIVALRLASEMAQPEEPETELDKAGADIGIVQSAEVSLLLFIGQSASPTKMISHSQ